MGQCYCIRRKPKHRIILLGLDGAGKTTLLNHLKKQSNIQATPTVGFSVEEVDLKRAHFSIWDVGGQQNARELWKSFFNYTDGMVFVADCKNYGRLPEAKKELLAVVEHPDMKTKPFIILSNKYDMPGAADMQEFSDQIEPDGVSLDRWSIHPVSVKPGHDLKEALYTLSARIKAFEYMDEEEEEDEEED